MKDNYVFGLGAIISLTVLECTALARGIDGAYFAPIMTLIGGIVGALLSVGYGTAKKDKDICVENKEEEN